MPLAETLITTVAPTIAKAVLKLWVGEDKVAAEGGAEAIDTLAKLIPDLRTRNEAKRQLDAIGEKAADSLKFIFETEGRTLLVDDQVAVADLVAETLDQTTITAELLVRRELDPARLAAHFLSEARGDLAHLPPPRVELFRRVIGEASQSIVDMAHQLPNFTERVFSELLRGNRVLVAAADRTLEELERIRSQTQVDLKAESVRFETDYRRAVARNLNKMELFGVELSHTSKFHPLSVAYVSLEVGRSVRGDDEGEQESVIHSVETALAESRRILIKGSAGAGKTTLVRWIAVQAASSAFEDPLKDWNDAVPFVIRLRQFSSSDFPAPEHFPALIAATVADTMPRGWVHQKLISGNAVIMVDGVDEVAEARRDEVRAWVKELTDTFPGVRLIVTSRPHAVEEGWLESDGFGEADLQPMDTASIENFVDHWHRAVAEETSQEDEAVSLTTLAKNLKETLRSNRAIRRLATSPLLCGVICALHRDTNEQLPGDRIELYERCCSMLLERRDPESGLALTGYPRLTYRQKRALLDDLAYWMIKNEWTEVSIDLATERLGRKLENLRTSATDGVAVSPESVLGFFLERSGMLREPLEGQVDFAHKTFQEFMAAKAAVDEGDIGVLVTHASNPQWREVITVLREVARCADRSDIDSYLKLVVPRLDISRLPGDAAGKVLMKFGFQDFIGLSHVTAVEFHNPPAGILLGLLYELPALRSLGLSGAGVDDLSLLRGLASEGAVNLASLTIKGTYITDLSLLRDLPYLEHLDLDLGYSPAELPDIASLAALTKLRSLRISTSQLKDLAPLEQPVVEVAQAKRPTPQGL